MSKKNGFRPAFIKLRNQFDYAVFNYTEAPGVVIGKKGMLSLNPIFRIAGIRIQGEEPLKMK